MAGKGDKRRPAAVKDDELEERWAAAFGKRPLDQTSDDDLPDHPDYRKEEQ